LLYACAKNEGDVILFIISVGFLCSQSVAVLWCCAFSDFRIFGSKAACAHVSCEDVTVADTDRFVTGVAFILNLLHGAGCYLKS
jgi:hypothetical protein